MSDKPEGPFTAQPEPIKGSFSIDPATFVDDDGSAYMYFGGLWGGQLQFYNADGTQYNGDLPEEPSGAGVRALGPRVAKLTSDMLEFAEPVRELVILDTDGQPIAADNHERRFFEASWLHKRGDTYYFSYSTGDTHLLAYATGPTPYGPFTYQGTILEPVLGWTTHHSIVEFEGKTYLFYHDCELSKGVDHLRSVKMREIEYDADGKIIPQKP